MQQAHDNTGSPAAEASPPERREFTPLKVVFLAGSDTAATRMSVEAVCRVANVVPVGMLFDIHQPRPSVRRKNLRRNIRRDGYGYMLRRTLLAVRSWLEAKEAGVAPKAEVDALLRAAFPDRNFSVFDLGRRYGFPVHEVDNLNSPAAVERLRALDAHLGIVLSARILKRTTFSVPELGCLNLHKGKVPEYRGMPPAFWELYEGAESAGVTVHFVDDGLDTGDIVGTREIAIHPKETVHSLRGKLDIAGASVLAASVADLRAGRAEPRKQPKSEKPARTKPTRVQERELVSRKPHAHAEPNDLKEIGKSAFRLAVYHSGLFSFVRKRHANRAVILLHHRVNDVSDDRLTTGTRVFAEQLVALRHYYRVVSTADIVARMREGRAMEPHSVAIHFDDCYRDVWLCAAPLLKAAGFPAAMFIATGFVGADRQFQHDASQPHSFENLHAGDIPGLIGSGFEVGAHTVNHVDLGVIDAVAARNEVVESKRRLEELSGGEVSLFSYPFGKRRHIREEIRRMVREAGFTALFSAYGGAVTPESDLFDIPRSGVNGRYGALALLFEIEGLSLGQLSPGNG